MDCKGSKTQHMFGFHYYILQFSCSKKLIVSAKIFDVYFVRKKDVIEVT